MTDLQKQFEATGYASWINSEIYPDGQIYTKEYTEWLENKVKTQLSAPSFLDAIKSNPITMQNQEKIIEAIAAYLERETIHYHTTSEGFALMFIGKEPPSKTDGVQEIAAELADAIAPHLEAGAGWEDAPEWAEFKTTTNSGDIIYWEHQPVCSPLGFWIAGNHSSRYEVREIKKGHLEQRPS